MKKFIALISFVISFNSFGQAPEGVNYQAVVRNVSGAIVSNSNVGIQMRILQGSVAGPSVYSESFNVTTSSKGLINVVVGEGTPMNGIFSNIDWASGPYFLEVSADSNGGTNYSLLGTQQMMSVPYALHAKTAESVIGGVSNGPQFLTPQMILDLPNANDITLFDTTIVDIDALLGFHPSSVILYYEHMFNPSASSASIRARITAFTDGLTIKVCEHYDGVNSGIYPSSGNSGQFILPVGPNGLITLWSSRVRSDLNIQLIGYFN